MHSGLMNVAGCVATGHTGRVYCIIVPFVSCCIILSYHSTGAALCWLRFFLVDHAGFALGFTVASFSYGMVAHCTLIPFELLVGLDMVRIHVSYPKRLLLLP